MEKNHENKLQKENAIYDRTTCVVVINHHETKGLQQVKESFSRRFPGRNVQTDRKILKNVNSENGASLNRKLWTSKICKKRSYLLKITYLYFFLCFR